MKCCCNETSELLRDESAAYCRRHSHTAVRPINLRQLALYFPQNGNVIDSSACTSSGSELFAIKVSHLHLRALLWWSGRRIDFPWCTIPGKSRRKRRRRRREACCCCCCCCEIDSIRVRWMLHLSPFGSLTALVPCFCYWIFRVNGDVSKARRDGKWEMDFHLECIERFAYKNIFTFLKEHLHSHNWSFSSMRRGILQSSSCADFFTSKNIFMS